MNVTVWNKNTNIKGFSPEYIINKFNIKDEDEILLVSNESQVVSEISFVNTIKSNYNLSANLTAEEVAQHYLEILNQQKINEEKEILSLEEANKKISILEDENKALNTKVDTVKYAHSDLILDMDFRIMDIEDNLGIVPMKINLLNRIGDNDMNSTFMLVLDKIEMGNYKNKEEIESICDRYLARNRITKEEYDTLMKALDKKEAEKNSVEA